jgi:hypothetical protein
MPLVDPRKPQIDKFREAARELETDDREEVFDAALKKVAKAPAKGNPEPKTRGSHER